MIKAKATYDDGRALYILGLSERNIEKLREGLPIKVALETLGGVGEVWITYGKTEQALRDDLAEFIGPNTDVRGFKEHGH